MNQDLEKLILAYEVLSISRDIEAARALNEFEILLDEILNKNPGISRELLRNSIIKSHRDWARKQNQKPPTIPPRA